LGTAPTSVVVGTAVSVMDAQAQARQDAAAAADSNMNDAVCRLLVGNPSQDQ
jgi:hypothetical protein